MGMRSRRAVLFQTESRIQKRSAAEWLLHRYGPQLTRNAQGRWVCLIWEETIYGFSIYDEQAAIDFKLAWG